MCKVCESTIRSESQQAQSALESSSVESRRRFLKLAGTASLAAPLAWAASASAVSAASPPKPDNALSPDAALERLMAGNERYVSGNTRAVNFENTREALAAGQNPYACLVSCADSRIGPEFAFDEERGDLFVTRVAGNFVTPEILASLEYGTAVLGAPLIMVLGHTSCGAIEAAVKAYTENAAFPGHIQSLTTALRPAVRQASDQGDAGDLVAAATLENIRQNVQDLQQANPILAERVANGQLKVVGGLYHLDTGRVELVA